MYMALPLFISVTGHGIIMDNANPVISYQVILEGVEQ